jgi:hypothetical protein
VNDRRVKPQIVGLIDDSLYLDDWYNRAYTARSRFPPATGKPMRTHRLGVASIEWWELRWESWMESRLSGRYARQIEYTAGRQNILADEYEVFYKEKLDDMSLDLLSFSDQTVGAGSEGR